MPLLVQNACLDQPLFPEAQSRAGAVFARPLCDTILNVVIVRQVENKSAGIKEE